MFGPVRYLGSHRTLRSELPGSRSTAEVLFLNIIVIMSDLGEDDGSEQTEQRQIEDYGNEEQQIQDDENEQQQIVEQQQPQDNGNDEQRPIIELFVKV